MFYPKTGGSFEIISDGDGGTYKCHLPPMPSKEKIAGYGLQKKKQKFKRVELPTFKAREIEWFSGDEHDPNEIIDWDTARREEIIKQRGEEK